MSTSIELPVEPSLLVSENGIEAPRCPEHVADLGVPISAIRELLLKFAHSVPTFTTQSAANAVRLPMRIAEELLWGLKDDHFLEVIGQQGHFNYSYRASKRGLEYAERCVDVCGYIGPAPVSLAHYSAVMAHQHLHRSQATYDSVLNSLSSLVLPTETKEIAALAKVSRRSLFVFGAAGNGKTSLGRLLHLSEDSPIWIPRCIAVGSSVIQIFDPEVHEEIQFEDVEHYDKRWALIKRPFVVAGGELTLESLDLIFSPSLRYYEAPPHVKANGGTFLIDDFGRQRMAPHELLNRWIIPLESNVDYLTTITGQKLQVPFLTDLVVATNLSMEDIGDPAFLRRMGYRLHLDAPTRENYSKIFLKYAKQHQVELTEGIIDVVLSRYDSEKRQLRASEPRDLLERAKDICRLRKISYRLDEEILNTAWRGYFGVSSTDATNAICASTPVSTQQVMLPQLEAR